MTQCHIYAVVEGHGEVEAIPKLLHRIWYSVEKSPTLRVDRPYRIRKGKFENDENKRKECLHITAGFAREDNANVFILMDADTDCCKDYLRDDKMKEIKADMDDILHGIPYMFCLAEKNYESWLVAGMGGGGKVRNPEQWLIDNPTKSGLSGTYRKRQEQAILTSNSNFDINLAKEHSASFRRLVNKISAMSIAD